MRITFTPTIEEFVAAQRAHAWRKYKARTASLQRVLQPVLGITLLVFALLMYRDGANSALILIEAMCGVYFLLAVNVIAPFLYRRHFRRTRGLGGEIILTVTDDSLTLDCPGRSAGTLEWRAILGVLDRSGVTLLYLSPGSFLYLSRRVLDDERRTELLAMCKSKGIPFTYPNLPKQKRA
jgi:hypothetical protein